MFQKIFLKLRLLQVPYQIYLVGTVLAVLSLVPPLIRRKPSTFFEVIALLAVIAFAVGFASWVGPQLKKIWDSSFGKLALALLHGLVLLLSAILARFLVAEALRLPPQDFDLTIGIWTLVLYLPVWLCTISVLTSLFGVIAMFYILVLIIVNGLREIASIFSLLLAPASLTPVSLQRGASGFEIKGWWHVMGVLAVLTLVAYIWTWSFAEIRSLGPLIRWVAYCADFQEASLYPGIEVNKKFRLHENGVVSYAERQGWDISISVEKVQ